MLHKYQSSRIILGYKLGLNLEKLSYTSYRIDIQLISVNRNKELFSYCRSHKNIYQVNKTIGGADFEIEVIVRDLNHLIEIIDNCAGYMTFCTQFSIWKTATIRAINHAVIHINDLKKEFKDVINDVEYFGFTTFHILKYIPD